MSVYKDSGVRLPMRVENGVPLCPCCCEPMVEVDPGYWQCAWSVKRDAFLRDKFAAAIDQAVEEKEKGQ